MNITLATVRPMAILTNPASKLPTWRAWRAWERCSRTPIVHRLSVRPARSAFVSGRWVHDIQAYNNCDVFAFNYPSYGGVLRDQGVYTVHAGKTDVYNQASALVLLENDFGRRSRRAG